MFFRKSNLKNINWHIFNDNYDVPNLIYQDKHFTSGRKAKFYFLSDLVCKIINSYCFRVVLSRFMLYLFTKRLVNLFVNRPSGSNSIANSSFSSSIFIKTNLWLKSVLSYRKKFKSFFSFLNNSYYISYTLKSFLLCLSNRNKKLLLHILGRKNLNYFFLNAIIQNILVKVKQGKKTRKSKSNNILFNLYQILYNRKKSSHLIFYLHLKCAFLSYFLNNINILSKKYGVGIGEIDIPNILNKINSIKHSTTVLVNLKKIPVIKKKYSVFNYNDFLKNFHSSLYYFFFLKKKNMVRDFKYLNYLHILKIKFKRDSLFLFKTQFSNLRSKITSNYYINRIKMFRHLNKLLSVSSYSVVGSTNRRKVFSYLFQLLRRFEKVTMGLTYYNQAKSARSKMCVFFSNLKIRKELLYRLGKRRYLEEFLVPSNTKLFLRYYVIQHYQISYTKIRKLYNRIYRKFRIKVINDLFYFLEYNLSFFLHKYICFFLLSLSNVYLNGIVCGSKDIILELGDFIYISSPEYRIFEHFFVFLNIFFFLDPLLLRDKFSFLYRFYVNFYFIYRNNFNDVLGISDVEKTTWLSSIMGELFSKTNNYFGLLKSSFLVLGKLRSKMSSSSPISLDDMTLCNDFSSLMTYKKHRLVQFNLNLTSTLSRTIKDSKDNKIRYLRRMFPEMTNLLYYNQLKKTSNLKNSSNTLNHLVYGSYVSKKLLHLKKKMFYNICSYV